MAFHDVYSLSPAESTLTRTIFSPYKSSPSTSDLYMFNLIPRTKTSSQNIRVIDRSFQNTYLLPTSTQRRTSHHLQYLHCYALSATISETKVLNEGNDRGESRVLTQYPMIPAITSHIVREISSSPGGTTIMSRVHCRDWAYMAPSPLQSILRTRKIQLWPSVTAPWMFFLPWSWNLLMENETNKPPTQVVLHKCTLHTRLEGHGSRAKYCSPWLLKQKVYEQSPVVPPDVARPNTFLQKNKSGE